MEKKKLIFLLSKTPVPAYEIHLEKQDWYKGCLKGVELAWRFPSSRILVATAFKPRNDQSEADYYRSALSQYSGWLPWEVVERGLETTEQLEYALEVARKENRELIVVCAWTHAMKAWWIARGKGVKVEFRYVFGRSRLLSIVADLALSYIYPFLEILELDRKFQQWIIRRRKKGIL